MSEFESSPGGGVLILAICIACLGLVVWLAFSSWRPHELFATTSAAASSPPVFDTPAVRTDGAPTALTSPP